MKRIRKNLNSPGKLAFFAFKVEFRSRRVSRRQPGRRMWRRLGTFALASADAGTESQAGTRVVVEVEAELLTHPPPRQWVDLPSTLVRLQSRKPVTSLLLKSSDNWNRTVPLRPDTGKASAEIVKKFWRLVANVPPRGARRRKTTNKPGSAPDWPAPAIALSSNREELALQQRLVRKRAFIKKHGVHAYIQRRFDAPMRSAAVSTSEDGDSGAEAPAVSTSNEVHVDAEAESAQVLRHFYESEHPFSPHR
ncbi:hypothetical protein B0H11DRAFT_1943732 [Mycena galericulata]|nr:hypothetical protein B0H11DRAFT_1943732 [Mycena galericulata]